MSSNDLSDRVIALTGATSGIGRRAAVTLAERGATVAAVGRNRERGEALAAESDAAAGTIRFHRADLATQSAVRDLAAELRESYDRLDVLAHNAGLSVRSRTETADGIELTLAVNHLAPYLLTRELFDQLAGSAPARVVVTASDLHRRATLDFDDLQFADGYDPLEAYARSKLANVAFTLELADRIPEAAGVTANCLHPGFVPSTNLFRDAALRTRLAVRIAGLLPGVGTTRRAAADRLVRLVASPEYAERTGRYVGEEEMTPADDTVDSETRERLWSVSADLVGIDPDWP
ncbi:SDR family NAD(P)-dependent oxidoreductase [Halorubrum lacusprofundi]|uniref:Short-chain dehydrogenase/reductase SDR n=1 Tax=Halorubrum lacusprofundi (strain ATCC 49239 / DSM 5036 / JCM 8891 / ACAM 34) TaxID=416348 RepID=B9LQ60_HALLT|nr:SDR family NAD(P)-dependent oxidoreductase [Halorubrum lacusprofundi]ACM57498.1 short-chain dehydrogenase/reductase SDR [Halorubrum lacusprofundi ATCC 49239]MCG1005905.1 SDR family NAD(P)-dependent oxidoreductase [Halorubrum lacusprofundi]